MNSFQETNPQAIPIPEINNISETIKNLKERLTNQQLTLSNLINGSATGDPELENLVKEIAITKALLISLEVPSTASDVGELRQVKKNREENLDNTSEEDKALSQLQKTHPKLKFYDDGDPFQFWDSFEAALSTRLLKKNTLLLF